MLPYLLEVTAKCCPEWAILLWLSSSFLSRFPRTSWNIRRNRGRKRSKCWMEQLKPSWWMTQKPLGNCLSPYAAELVFICLYLFLVQGLLPELKKKKNNNFCVALFVRHNRNHVKWSMIIDLYGWKMSKKLARSQSHDVMEQEILPNPKIRAGMAQWLEQPSGKQGVAGLVLTLCGVCVRMSLSKILSP